MRRFSLDGVDTFASSFLLQPATITTSTMKSTSILLLNVIINISFLSYNIFRIL